MFVHDLPEHGTTSTHTHLNHICVYVCIRRFMRPFVQQHHKYRFVILSCIAVARIHRSHILHIANSTRLITIQAGVTARPSILCVNTKQVCRLDKMRKRWKGVQFSKPVFSALWKTSNAWHITHPVLVNAAWPAAFDGRPRVAHSFLCLPCTLTTWNNPVSALENH